MPSKGFKKAKRLIEQLEPVLTAAENLRSAYDAVIKEPTGHPNMHPVRAAMKELEEELEWALGQIARSRREDTLERQHRQSKHR